MGGLGWTLLALVGCGAAAPTSETVPGGDVVSWADDFFPETIQGEVELQVWGRHRALLLGRRVYASTGDDMATQAMAAVYPYLLGSAAIENRRVALIGIGSGVELAVFLDAGAHVDVYERDPSLLAMAEHVGGDQTPLIWQDGVPQHERLRILSTPEDAAATPPTYDAILHAVGLNVICRPPNLFIKDRLERLASHLSPGGVLGVHLQLYEIRPEMHRRLVRTFADAFPHVIAVTPEDLSSDMLLYGGRDSIGMTASSLRQAYAYAPWAWARNVAGFGRALTPAALVLLRDRLEVLSYTGDASAFTEADPLFLLDWPVRPESIGGPDDTDDSDWDRWEQRRNAWAEEQGFDESFLVGFYSPDWQFGHPCNEPDCARFGARNADDLVELGYAFLETGRKGRAAELVATTHRLFPGHAANVRAADVIRGLLTPVPAPDVPIAQWLSPGASSTSAERIAAQWNTAARSGLWEPVFEALDSWPDTAPQATALLRVLARHFELGDGPTVEGVEIDDAWLDAHPVAWRLLAQVHDDDFRFRAAVLAMKRYFDLGGTVP